MQNEIFTQVLFLKSPSLVRTQDKQTYKLRARRLSPIKARNSEVRANLMNTKFANMFPAFFIFLYLDITLKFFFSGDPAGR